MMTASSPTIDISKADDKWTIKTSTLMSSNTSTFVLGEEYEETMMGGRSIKVKIPIEYMNSCIIFSDSWQNTTTIEDNKIITTSQSDRGKSQR